MKGCEHMKMGTISIYGGNITGQDAGKAVQADRKAAKDSVRNNAKGTGGSVIDGSSLGAVVDSVAEKRAKAQKKAMKIISDAFANERKIDDDLQARRDRVSALQKETAANRKVIGELEDAREALREQYGVEADSQEQKDLELLAKKEEVQFNGSDIRLTQEEYQRIEEIEAGGLTEYQQRSLEMKQQEAVYADAATKAQEEMRTENAVIRGTRLERLKSNPMGKAKAEADATLEAAGQEILGMLYEEGKENLDRKLEEELEKAEEAAEKKEEQEERIEARRKEKKDAEELTEDILKTADELGTGVGGISDAQQEIKDMMNKLKLVEEDVKGAAVDQEV